MVAIPRGPGRPSRSVASSQLVPPSVVTQSAPSSVPTYRMSGSTGDSPIAVALP